MEEKKVQRLIFGGLVVMAILLTVITIGVQKQRSGENYQQMVQEQATPQKEERQSEEDNQALFGNDDASNQQFKPSLKDIVDQKVVNDDVYKRLIANEGKAVQQSGLQYDHKEYDAIESRYLASYALNNFNELPKDEVILLLFFSPKLQSARQYDAIIEQWLQNRDESDDGMKLKMINTAVFNDVDHQYYEFRSQGKPVANFLGPEDLFFVGIADNQVVVEIPKSATLDRGEFDEAWIEHIFQLILDAQKEMAQDK